VISELINFRDTQPTLAPVQRFQSDLAARPGMARGQDGFAIPFLYDSFIHDFTPVYPDAIQVGNLRPIGGCPLGPAGICGVRYLFVHGFRRKSSCERVVCCNGAAIPTDPEIGSPR
jgi:hypothetical protein